MFFDLFGFNLFVLSVLTGLVALYIHLNRKLKYWSSRGIDGPKPYPLIGTVWQNFFQTVPELSVENTRRYGKTYGVFLGNRPMLMTSDPELIKTINIRDFHNFVNRNEFKTGDPLNDRSLFNLLGDEWKTMRSIISPTFSSGKMRKMHPIIVGCVQRLEKYLEVKAVNKSEIELKKVMSNLTMDVIATCAFGTKVDVYNDEKTSDFITNAKKVFKFDWKVLMKFLILSTFPNVIKYITIQVNDKNAINFFKSAIQSIISRRKTEKVKSNDYLQLILNAQNKTLEAEEQEIEDNESKLYGETESNKLLDNKIKTEITETDILATSLLFFLAGYETTASLLSHVFYSLAVNEKCQQKLYEEVNQLNGEYDYESIAGMPYLESCVAETLRLYNPLPQVGRMASEEYTLGDTGITVPKGMIIGCDFHTIHHSPEYYPEPNRWSPERFMPENRDLLIPDTYMPFGIGPRNCVGMRFALMEAKTAIAHLVYKFRFVRTANTTVPLKEKKFDFLLNTGDKVVAIELRNK